MLDHPMPSVTPRPAATPPPRPIARFGRWLVAWWPLLIVLIGGAALRFSGYLYGLPYYDHIDEPWLFYEAAFQRGLISDWLHPNPSPGLNNLYKLAQVITEALTGQSALAHVPQTLSVLRFISVILSLLTLIVIALGANELGGRKAGWFAAALWASIPLVVYHSFIAIAEPWMMLFAAIALYTAARGLQQRSARLLIASVWGGLFAFTFKYSMFPFVGVGIGAVLWLLWRRWREPAVRRYWGRILFIQALSIVGLLLYLVLFQGLGQSITNPTREVAVFFDSPLQRLLDLPKVASIYAAAFPQFGLSFVSFAVLYGASLVVLVRSHAPAEKIVLWVGYGALASFSALLIPLYLLTDATIERYLFAANLVFVTLAASAAAVLYEALDKAIIARVTGVMVRRTAQVAVLGLAALWIAPILGQAVAEAAIRRLPNTLTDMTVWASNTLEAGGILTEGAAHRVFSREFGGYTGPTLERLNGINPLDKPIAAWQQAGVRYIEMTQLQGMALDETNEGRAFLAQLQHLRSFPPPESTDAWGGLPFAVFRLGRPESAADVSFGDIIRLHGYDGVTAQIKRGGTLPLRFYWRAIQLPPENYSVFVHLQPADGSALLAQVDGAPGPVGRPTRTWTLPSETLVSAVLPLTIPAELPAGSYRLIIGIYNSQTGARLSTDKNGDSYLLGMVEVRP